ncbi:MAG: enoyl-CoA hydratase/isomerase family protein [Lysobacterales bacterium]
MLNIIRHDPIYELRLARPPVNALDPALVRALRIAVEAAPDEGARAVVLSGAPGMFSAGLDVPALLQLDRDAFRPFWNDFFGLCAALACSPIPVVAAITGHAPAGGAVLAIMCDYRVMARGAFRIGLNEVQVGLSVPECIQAALRRLVGAYRAERLMVAGTMLDAEHAHAIGLVDELVDTDFVVPRALAWLGEVLKFPPQAMSETRRLARADLAAVFADPAALPVEDFLDGWFAAEAQNVLKSLVARLKSR